MRDLLNRLSTPEFWADFSLISGIIITVLVVVYGHN